jgi:SAM-dependent methyltransferase
MQEPTISLKERVRKHWENEACGTRGIEPSDRRAFFENIESERYQLEPYIMEFANFAAGNGKKVLEIGVGAGTDFLKWVRAGADVTGVDLTDEAIALTSERLGIDNHSARLLRADAENLPFEENSFDIVYSHGVLHHSPDTPKAVREVHRVLKPGGMALIMICHVPSLVGFMLWGIHCVAKFRFWRTPRWAIYNFLESPGTKAYTVRECRVLFSDFRDAVIRTQLTHGDLLMMRPSSKYQGVLHSIIWRLYPRRLLKTLGNRFGLYLYIRAEK